MGFLKFLKREKKPDVNELDLPPEPPPLEGFEDKHDFPEFPEIKAPDDFDLSRFDVAEDKTDSSGYESEMLGMKDMPVFPGFPELKEEPETAAEPETSSQTLPATAPAAEPVPVAEQKEMPRSEPQHMQRPRRLFHHEKKDWERPVRKEIYVRVDKFKTVLDGISMIRASVRKSDEALMRLESIKNSKDKSFDKVKSSLEDLQKKLIFIDRTLFEGD